MKNKKESILVVLPFAFFHPGGSTLNSFYRVKSLLELGYAVDVLCYPHGELIEYQNLRLVRAPKLKLFKNYQAGQYLKKIIYEFFIILTFIKLTIQNKYKYIITHSISIFSVIFLKTFNRAKFIANVHGNLEVESVKWGFSKRNFIIKTLGKFEKICLLRYNYIITIHKSVRDVLIKNGINKENINVINNAVDSHEPLNSEQIGKKVIVLYTGTFVKVQNIELIYDTANLCRNENIEFWLVGAMENEFKYHNSLILKENLSDIVKLYPRKTQKELKYFYSLADIVVSPRTYGHDTPMKLFDYMNFGKCILASNRPIHTEVLNNKNSLLVEPNPASFLSGITLLKDNADLKNKIAEQAKKDFEEKYSLRVMKNKYKVLFESL